MGFETAAGEDREVALRLEHAEAKDQLFGHAPPAAAQLVMTADAADALAIELIQAANRARGAASN